MADILYHHRLARAAASELWMLHQLLPAGERDVSAADLILADSGFDRLAATVVDRIERLQETNAGWSPLPESTELAFASAAVANGGPRRIGDSAASSTHAAVRSAAMGVGVFWRGVQDGAQKYGREPIDVIREQLELHDETYAEFLGVFPAFDHSAVDSALVIEASIAAAGAAPEPDDREPPAPKPKWESDNDTLTFDGEVIRIFARNASNCRMVLDAFEAAGWPQVIANPLCALGKKDGTRINDTVDSLNTGLSRIKFHAGGDSETFKWSRVAPPAKKKPKKSTSP